MEGGESGGHGEHGHALGPVMLGELDQGQGERQGDQGATGKALQGAEHDHAFQAPGHGAEQGGNKKAHRDPDRQAPGREQLHQPGGEGDHDDLRHQVGSGDPRAFLQGSGQRALDVLERGVGDLDVEHRHEGAEHGTHHRDPVAPGGFAHRTQQLITGHRRGL